MSAWRERWRRRPRAVRWPVTLVVWMVALRLLLALLLPLGLALAARSKGLRADWDELSLALRSGVLDLRGLRVAPRVEGDAEPAPWLTLERLHADLALGDLLRGSLRLQRLEVDGLEVALERRADGSIPWLEHLGGGAQAPEPAPAAGPLDLRSPIAIDHLRASHLVLELADAAVPGGCRLRLAADLRGEDLGREEREGTLHAELRAPGLCEHASLELRERSSEHDASAELALALQGCAPGALAGYLAPLGLAPDARVLEGRTRLVAEFHPGATPQSLTARVELRDLDFTRDGEEALALERLSLYAAELAPGAVRGIELELGGLRALARRNAAGEPCFGGLRVIPVAPAASVAPAPASAGPAPRWSLAKLELKDLHLALRDENLVEPCTLAFELPSLAVDAFDPGADGKTELHAVARAPGNLKRLTLNAALVRRGARGQLEFELYGDGLSLAGLRPYLLASGVEWAGGNDALSSSGRLDLESGPDGVWRGRAEFTAGCGGTSLGDAELAGLEFDPRARSLSIAAVDLQRLYANLGRTQDGRFFLQPFVVSNAPPPARHPLAPAPAATAPSAPFALQIGKLRLHDNGLDWSDFARPESRVQHVRDFGLELDGLKLGSEASSKLHAWVRAPELLGTLDLSGELKSGPQSLGAELAFDLARLDRTLPSIFLAPLGIELEWTYPHLAGKLDARLADGKLAAHVRDLVFEDEGRRYASAHELGIEELAPGSLGRIRVRGLECALARDEAGALHAFGLKLAPPASAAPAPAAPAGRMFPAIPELAWESLDLEDARLDWADAAQGRKLETRLTGSLHCGVLRAGEHVEPLVYGLRLQAEKLCGGLELRGEARLGADELALDGTLEAHGLSARLGGYLPPGLELRSESDKLALRYHARCVSRGDLAVGVEASLRELRWGDGQAPDALALGEARIDLPRVSAIEVEVGELALRGLVCRASKRLDGSLELGPLRSYAVPPPPLEPAPAPAAAVAAPPLPRLVVDKLALELERFEYRDEAQLAGAEPLVASFAFATEKPLVLADPAPETLPPLEFVLRGSALPLAAKVELRAALKQWLVQPQFDLHVLAQGLRGAALTELFPALAAKFDGRGLEGGELEAALHGELSFARRGTGRFDFARPFAAEFALGPVALRSGPGGETLAGLERLEAEIERIDPRTGSVQLKSLELSKPFLRVERTPEGLSTCGLRLLPGTDAPAAPAGPASSGGAAPEAPRSDFGIARLSANGLDVVFTDRTVDPPVALPLTDLDLELRGFTTRALREPIALPFSGSLRSGKIGLPPHGSVKEPSERDLFGTCELAGRVQLFPELAGWFRFGLDELQLVHFRALAAQSGVVLEDGRLDLALRGRLSGARGLSLESVTVLSEIDVSEGEAAPIQKALGLPSPTAAVLALVRDLEGNVRLPARMHLESGALSKSEIVSTALASVSAILMRAVLSSPFRVVGGVAGSLGLGGSGGPTRVEEQLLEFDEASAQHEGLPEAERLRLAGRVSADDRVRIVLEHEFCAADLARSGVLANPGPADCRELSQRLRQKKAELSRSRAETAALARVDYAVGRTAEAEAARERLRAIDAELGRSEDALDRVHELLRIGADRHAAARLRAAARSLAGARLERVRAGLLAIGIDPARIEVKPPRIEAGTRERGCVRVRLVRAD